MYVREDSSAENCIVMAHNRETRPEQQPTDVCTFRSFKIKRKYAVEEVPPDYNLISPTAIICVLCMWARCIESGRIFSREDLEIFLSKIVYEKGKCFMKVGRAHTVVYLAPVSRRMFEALRERENHELFCRNTNSSLPDRKCMFICKVCYNVCKWIQNN